MHIAHSRCCTAETDNIIEQFLLLFSLQVVSGSFEVPWTVAHQAPPSMGCHRQEHWSGLPFPSPGDLPDPGIEPTSPAWQLDSSTSESPESNYMSIFKKQI